MPSFSQKMPPYRRFSLMRIRALRRLFYGRGHGIHSPLAYASVFSLLRPFSGYYIDDEEIAEVAGEDEMVWFRMLARLRPSETRYELRQEGLFRAMERYAFSRQDPSGPLLAVTDTRQGADRIFGENQTRRPLVLLYSGVRENGACERDFLSVLSSFQNGVVLDFFTGALFFNNNQERYYYRTTL